MESPSVFSERNGLSLWSSRIAAVFYPIEGRPGAGPPAWSIIHA